MYSTFVWCSMYSNVSCTSCKALGSPLFQSIESKIQMIVSICARPFCLITEQKIEYREMRSLYWKIFLSSAFGDISWKVIHRSRRCWRKGSLYFCFDSQPPWSCWWRAWFFLPSQIGVFGEIITRCRFDFRFSRLVWSHFYSSIDAHWFSIDRSPSYDHRIMVLS